MEKYTRKKRKKKRIESKKKRAFALIPSNTQGEPRRIQKEHIISSSKSKGLLETQKKIIKSSRSKLQHLLQGVQAATKLDN